ncbi:MAG: imidazole glycerol phosphate synthase subunit HisF [Candidatus Diapherotrites archaeon CG08_land_8_20_14_0_20_34_12]|nr:MAG: imidazole glycerol phosphate synthase subunit HisF [Candidatus Diapherotrites archaeon CG08_land_8_20_14_0_20_34_12]
MLKKRIIPCLDCITINKEIKVVKGRNFRNLRPINNPVKLAEKYYLQGADELCFLDIGATVESRKTMVSMIKKVSKKVFIPLTVGGGIKTLEDAEKLFKNGADKVAINTAAIENPALIAEISNQFGKQACVVAIDSKKVNGLNKVFSMAGTKEIELLTENWAKQVERLGAGEILLTSIDQDGTKQGYDIELTRKISENSRIPIIASGGCGSLQDMAEIIQKGKADAVLAASIFHYDNYSIKEVKKYLKSKNIDVRF